jgi:hypothetical protein
MLLRLSMSMAPLYPTSGGPTRSLAQTNKTWPGESQSVVKAGALTWALPIYDHAYCISTQVTALPP